MSYVRICDTCNRSRIELDSEDPSSLELPEGWTTDEFERDHCNLCNLEAEGFEAGEATEEEASELEKALKKETRKLNRLKKLKNKEVDNVE